MKRLRSGLIPYKRARLLTVFTPSKEGGDGCSNIKVCFNKASIKVSKSKKDLYLLVVY